MNDDFESLDDIADQNDPHGNSRSHRGAKRRRSPRHGAAPRGSLQAILRGSKRRKQRKITLATTEAR